MVCNRTILVYSVANSPGRANLKILSALCALITQLSLNHAILFFSCVNNFQSLKS